MAVVCGLVLWTAVNAGAQTKPAAPRNDIQLWPEVQVTIALNERIDLTGQGQLRIGCDASDFVDERAGLGISFKVNRYLALAPSRLYIATQPTPRQTRHENRLNFAAIVRSPEVGGFTLINRALFERRLRDPFHSTRYRNRLQVEHPVRIGEMKLKIWASDEVFYDWSAGAWVRNRFRVGAAKDLSKTLAPDMYYMRQNDGHSRPGDIHLVGAILRVRR